jgi:two-component system, NarL family, invasion response regulator UvrY
MLRVLVADDHALIRTGLKQVLLAGGCRAAVGEAQNAGETLEQVSRHDWDILLLDIAMPGRSGLDVLRDLKLLRPKLPVLILSAYSEIQFGLRVLKAGAAGFMRKDCAHSELIGAIKLVLAGGKYISPPLAERLASTLTDKPAAVSHENLSDREYEVMCLMGSGKTATQIAKSLALSVKTISTYRTRILAKLHLANSAQLTYYAIKNGLIEP